MSADAKANGRTPEPDAFGALDPRVHVEPEREGGDFIYVYPLDGGRSVRVRLFNLYEDSARELHAQVRVTAHRPDGEKHGTLLLTRVKLLSPRSQSEAVKELQRVNDRLLPWVEVVRWAAVKTHDLFNTPPVPTPYRNIAFGPLEYLIEGVLPKNEMTVLYGDSGSLKSYVSEALALAVSSGREVGGLVPNGPPTPVLYMDWETSAAVHARRMNRLCAGLGVEVPENVYYQWLERPLVDMGHLVQQMVAEYRAGLVVIDSLAWAAGQDINKPEVVIPFGSAVRSLGQTVTKLVITHISNAAAVAQETGKQKGASRPFGSAFTRAAARQTWEVRRGSSTDRDHITIGMHNEKVNEGPPMPPVGLRFAFDGYEGPVAVSPTDWTADPVGAKSLPVADRIEAALAKQGRMATKEIAQEVGESESTVRVTLGRLQKAGRVVTFGASKGRNQNEWGLAAFDDQIPDEERY